MWCMCEIVLAQVWTYIALLLPTRGVHVAPARLSHAAPTARSKAHCICCLIPRQISDPHGYLRTSGKFPFIFILARRSLDVDRDDADLVERLVALVPPHVLNLVDDIEAACSATEDAYKRSSSSGLELG